MEEQEEFKENLTFHDLENNLINLEIEISKDGRFSISGDCGQSSGQIHEHIKPKNEEHKRLLEIWANYHLNDLHAGTEKQERALEEWRKKNKIEGWAYEKEVKFLKSKKLYSDKGYKYGSNWLKRELPHTLETELKTLIQTIRRQETKRKENFKILSFSDVNIEDNKIIALALNLDLEPKEAEEDIKDEGDNIYSYCGTDYFIGTEEETEQECKTYLTDDTELYKYYLENELKTGGAYGIMNIEDWADWVINSDGYGQILNHYDGSEDTENINGTCYFIIRR